MWQTFWAWYEKHYVLSVGIALGLFLLQILHLVWLFCAVVWLKLFGVPLIVFGDLFNVAIAVVDYTEVPALIGISLLYIHELRSGFKLESVVYLLLLNTQWLHLFWITDEIVVETLTPYSIAAIPLWLAWIAILIDYAEVPVMVDTTRKFLRSWSQSRSLSPR